MDKQDIQLELAEIERLLAASDCLRHRSIELATEAGATKNAAETRRYKLASRILGLSIGDTISGTVVDYAAIDESVSLKQVKGWRVVDLQAFFDDLENIACYPLALPPDDYAKPPGERPGSYPVRNWTRN